MRVWCAMVCRPCKALMTVAVRALCGVEPQDMSFLHFLQYLRSSGGFERLCTIRNGNQVRHTLCCLCCRGCRCHWEWVCGCVYPHQ